ncbi:hypothetical protein GCM10009118_28870 [Wandonia haliotis]|uniref:Tetratricopeptide repeat protein n=1 Tax=Wandonia haliotis TaxID=574963 RepID=A0ABN1MT09_9FLAO
MAKYLSLTLLFVAVVTIKSFSQTKKNENYIDYYNLVNEASFWFYEQQYDSAILFYEKAIQSVNVSSGIDRYNLARSYWEVNRKKDALKLLSQSKHIEGLQDIFIDDTTYFEGMTVSQKSRLVKKLIKNELPYNKKHNEFVQSLFKKDQRLRILIRDSIRPYYEKDSIIMGEYLEKLRETDSINGLELINYVKSNGMPGGVHGQFHKLSIIFVHMSKEWFVSNYRTLFKEINKGNLDPYFFAKGMDRAFKQNPCERFTIYNAYFHDKDYTDPWLLYVNRLSIGLSPYYIDTWNLYPKGQSPKRTAMFDFYKKHKTQFNYLK